jgi:3-isopropylmalate/(R)-2-methylmalate dehydratase small subunit
VRAVSSVTGRGVPLGRSDVDTDQIIPSDWLKRVERTGFGKGLFSEWRDGPDFVLNDERYLGATVLIAGPNFGIGSSREHAVWALLDYGFEAVVSSSFADIFFSNCTKQGLLPVVLADEALERLTTAVREDPELELTIDVVHRLLEIPAIGYEEHFELDDFTVERFVQGWDDISLTLHHESQLAEFERTRPGYLPVTSS